MSAGGHGGDARIPSRVGGSPLRKEDDKTIEDELEANPARSFSIRSKESLSCTF